MKGKKSMESGSYPQQARHFGQNGACDNKSAVRATALHAGSAQLPLPAGIVSGYVDRLEEVTTKKARHDQS
jgi:hypothetical protein